MDTENIQLIFFGPTLWNHLKKATCPFKMYKLFIWRGPSGIFFLNVTRSKRDLYGEAEDTSILSSFFSRWLAHPFTKSKQYLHP